MVISSLLVIILLSVPRPINSKLRGGSIGLGFFWREGGNEKLSGVD
jgi:hypothetical protein